MTEKTYHTPGYDRVMKNLAASRAAKLPIKIESDISRVRADRDRYRDMLQQICTNAIPAGKDSCEQDMMKMRRVLIETARHLLANRANRE